MMTTVRLTILTAGLISSFSFTSAAAGRELNSSYFYVDLQNGRNLVANQIFKIQVTKLDHGQ